MKYGRKKLTDEDVIKALKNCINGDHKTKCKNCYYHIYDDTCLSMDKAVLNLINSLQSKIEKLKNDSRNKTNSIRELRDKKNKLQKQVDELNKKLIARESVFHNLVIVEKEQTVKDTAKEIEDKIQELLNTPFDGKTEKQEYQRKGMEEGLKMALEIVRECKGVEVE